MMSQELMTSGDTVGMRMSEEPVKTKPLTLPMSPHRTTKGDLRACCSVITLLLTPYVPGRHFWWDTLARNCKVCTCSHRFLGSLLIECGRCEAQTSARNFFRWRRICILIPPPLRTGHLWNFPPSSEPQGAAPCAASTFRVCYPGFQMKHLSSRILV